MITYRLLSRTGGRTDNEDYVNARELGDRCCFVAADGLGGHQKGEVACRAAAEQILSEFAAVKEVSAKSIRQCMEAGQQALMELKRELGHRDGMKTTMAVLMMDRKKAVWAHVGDTRIYVFRKGKLLARTKDHSVPQMLVEAGELTEDQIRGHYARNQLLQVMGVPWDGPQYTVAEPLPLKKGQAYLLCTDGFWELVEEEEMLACLQSSKNPSVWLSKMEKLLLGRGRPEEMDNYSAIGIYVG